MRPADSVRIREAPSPLCRLTVASAQLRRIKQAQCDTGQGKGQQIQQDERDKQSTVTAHPAYSHVAQKV